MGWWPGGGWMILGRRMPGPAGPWTTKPSSSGPRWAMRSLMRLRTAASGVRSRRARTLPTMPHTALVRRVHAHRLADVVGGLAGGVVEAADGDLGEGAGGEGGDGRQGGGEHQ